jgi:hypothetical protein
MAVEPDLLYWMRHTREPPEGDEVADVGRPVRHPAIARVLDELRAVGIGLPLRFVWAGDGSGVDPDEPLLIHVHRSLARGEAAPDRLRAEAERTVALDVASVARHEVGHALLFRRPGDAHTPEFRRLFGDVDVQYRVGDPIREVTRRLDRHGGFANPRYRREVSLYAATHPHRRWAEDWRLAPRVAEQLSFAAAWLRSYDGRPRSR